MRPLLLDAFCGQGGAAKGYDDAGFDVVGVDHKPQPNYPYAFHQADAVEFIYEYGYEFDVVHASPPCQVHSTITAPDAKDKHLDLIPPTRAALELIGRPSVIENVEGAREELISPLKLCGSSFGLLVRRHRYFEINARQPWPPVLPQLGCRHDIYPTDGPFGIYGEHPGASGSNGHLRPNGNSRGRRPDTVEQASECMGGVEWMDWDGMAQAIPPAYTRYIGHYLQVVLAL